MCAIIMNEVKLGCPAFAASGWSEIAIARSKIWTNADGKIEDVDSVVLRCGVRLDEGSQK